MSKRTMLAGVALVLVAAVGLAIYLARFSPTARAREAAHHFWLAVVAGDVGAVEAMLAPEADFTASQMIESHREFCFGGPCGGDRPAGDVIWVKGSTLTGAEVLVNSVVRDPDSGAGEGRGLAMKRVKGRWMVTRQGSGFSF